jgi:endonuclease/exonuclease/phosphatase family metal-dependent hydrolase
VPLLAVLAIWIFATRVQLTSARESSRDTTLATFNVGLLEGMVGDSIDARAAVLVDQMIRSDVDIFCLQEVWEVRIQRQIRTALRDTYPYVLSAIDLDSESDSDELACDSDKLDAFFACRDLACPGQTGPALAFCGSLSCHVQLASLSLPCKLCVFYEFLVNPDTPCRTALARDNERTFGLMMLSTKELKNPTATPYNNQSEIRGFLTASVDGVGDLVCTHLTTPIAPPPFYIGPPIVEPLLYDSYPEQHRDEILKLFEVIETMEVPIIMGDFNHGPGGPGGLTLKYPFYYGLMNARGFVSPYILKDGRCTACIDNHLRNTNIDELVDHIYITTDTTERVRSAERIYDVIFPSIRDFISDHYGVKVRLSNVRERCNYIQKCRYHCVSEIKELLPFQLDYSEVCF